MIVMIAQRWTEENYTSPQRKITNLANLSVSVKYVQFLLVRFPVDSEIWLCFLLKLSASEDGHRNKQTNKQ